MPGGSSRYAEPTSRFVFDFLGHVNVFAGEQQGPLLSQGDAWVRLPADATEQAAQLYMRPHEVSLQSMPAAHAHLPLCIESISLVGAEVRLELSPIGWETQEHWEVGITHAQFNSWQPSRGDHCFAAPRVAHIFGHEEQAPETIRWAIGELDDPAAMI